REFEGNLIYQASHDALTGLPNRVLLEDRVMHDIARARRNKRRVAIMYLDLDQFKRVNDGFGHKTGDLMLRVCADRLLSNLRDADTVGRLGGDEFLVVLPDLSDATVVRTLAYRLLEDFRRPLRVQGRDLFSTVSIGVAVFPDDGERAEILLQNADTALYRAKDGGRDNVCFFQPQHSQAAARRTEVESALRDALVQDELSVVYQPKANGRTLQWDGAEALVRWHSGQLGDVSPAEFIPVAEDSGLIDAIGWFVIDSALRDLHRIRERVPDFGMAVNVSVRQFRDPTFIRHLLDRLHKADVPCHALELEVTESIMAEGVPELEALREAGLRLAIDDFGTGFSSLSYLKRLPVTTLKLDRAFVSDLETDNADRALITAIMAVARELDLDTVAEGVETQGQLAFLQARHCSHLQGYLLGRPMPLADLLDRLPT
ncbi:MAG: EAL domain-containing protein, partial [Gammaproteobacteria bacterium]|nr:EAL domain-containing protein [Gammaproteobacteria bacterium]